MGRPIDLPPAEHFPHGTRGRYTCGCHCQPCRDARSAYERERVRRIRAAVSEVVPNPGESFGVLMRAGKAHRVRLCLGCNGKPCVKGGAWLRGQPVCLACVDRAAVWNGLVDASPAREHLAKLSAAGVGYKAVAAACDISATTLCGIISGRTPRIRGNTSRRILAVDEGARADHGLVDGAPTYALLASLKERGFSQTWIATSLGYKDSASWFTVKPARVTAASAAKIARLVRRVEEEKIVPPPFKGLVPAGPTQRKLREMVAEGFTKKAMTARLGVTVDVKMMRARFVRLSTENAVASWYEEITAEGEALPSDTHDHRSDDVLAAVRAGERSAAQIAEEFGITSRTVERIKAKARLAEAA
jgi:hypothetical protein